MASRALKLFLTGDPGCGKTTVLRRVVERAGHDVAMTGFLTDELREGSRRKGFVGTTLDGRTFVLADREIPGELRVGPYGVDLEGLETIGLAALEPREDTALVVLDEVGKMELLSQKFRRRVGELLDAEVPLLATIGSRGVGFIKRVRNDPRVTLIQMRRHTSDATVGEVLRRLTDAGVLAR